MSNVNQTNIPSLQFTQFVDPFLTTMRGDNRKHPEPIIVRRMTVPEAKALKYGDHVYILDDNWKVGNVKINGAPKTWKRKYPFQVEVSWKFGLYEYGKDKAFAPYGIEDADARMSRLVIRLIPHGTTKCSVCGQTASMDGWTMDTPPRIIMSCGDAVRWQSAIS